MHFNYLSSINGSLFFIEYRISLIRNILRGWRRTFTNNRSTFDSNSHIAFYSELHTTIKLDSVFLQLTVGEIKDNDSALSLMLHFKLPRKTFV